MPGPRIDSPARKAQKAAHQKRWRAAHPDYGKKYMRAWVASHPEYRKSRKKYLREWRAKQPQEYRDAERVRKRIAAKIYRAKNPEKISAYYRAYRKRASKKPIIAARDKRYRERHPGMKNFKRHNITAAQYQEMLAKGKGGCWMCGRKPPFGRFKFLHIDHDHVSQEVRGLLCPLHNLALNHIEASFFAMAMEYLNRSVVAEQSGAT